MKQNCVTTAMDLLTSQGGRFVAAWQLVASAWVLALTTSVWAVKRWVRNILS